MQVITKEQMKAGTRYLGCILAWLGDRREACAGCLGTWPLWRRHARDQNTPEHLGTWTVLRAIQCCSSCGLLAQAVIRMLLTVCWLYRGSF